MHAFTHVFAQFGSRMCGTLQRTQQGSSASLFLQSRDTQSDARSCSPPLPCRTDPINSPSARRHTTANAAVQFPMLLRWTLLQVRDFELTLETAFSEDSHTRKLRLAKELVPTQKKEKHMPSNFALANSPTGAAAIVVGQQNARATAPVIPLFSLVCSPPSVTREHRSRRMLHTGKN